MALNIEEYVAGIRQQGGIITAEPVVINNDLTVTGTTTTENSATTIKSTSANALAVGANGTTNPVFNVDASTASVATGLDVKGAAAAAGVAVSVLSSGTNEALTIDAKGSGSVTINGTATGEVIIGSQLQLADNGTATATSGAATLNKIAGVVTSESLTTAAGATYTLTVTDSAIAATDIVFASVALGTATTGMPAVTTVTPAAGSLVIIVQNIAASAALNGTIKIAFAAIKTA